MAWLPTPNMSAWACKMRVLRPMERCPHLQLERSILFALFHSNALLSPLLRSLYSLSLVYTGLPVRHVDPPFPTCYKLFLFFFFSLSLVQIHTAPLSIGSLQGLENETNKYTGLSFNISFFPLFPDLSILPSPTSHLTPHTPVSVNALYVRFIIEARTAQDSRLGVGITYNKQEQGGAAWINIKLIFYTGNLP